MATGKYMLAIFSLVSVAFLISLLVPTRSSFEHKASFLQAYSSDDNRQTARNTAMFHTNIPMYYINLDRSPHRRDYMEAAFGHCGKLIRVEAVDSHTAPLESLIGFGGLKSHSFTTMKEYYKASRVSKGELALTMSHAKAIKQAFDNGDETAVIFEDDVSTMLSPFWRVTLDGLKDKADQDHPGWELIRLQYSLIQDYHGLQIEEQLKNNPSDFWTRRRLPAYGMAAYMVSRKGMSAFIERFLDHEGKFDCLQRQKAYQCAADMMIHTAMEKVILPLVPLFVTRIFEDATGVRRHGEENTISDQYKKHIGHVVSSLQRALTHWEYVLSLSAEPKTGDDQNAKELFLSQVEFPTVRWAIAKV